MAGRKDRGTSGGGNCTKVAACCTSQAERPNIRVAGKPPTVGPHELGYEQSIEGQNVNQTARAQELDLQERLAQEFEFDQDDLNANRLGMLSDRQKYTLGGWRAVLAIAGTCLISAGVFALIGLQFRAATNARPLDIVGLISAVLSGAVLVIADIALIWLILRSLRAKAGRIKCITGRVQFERKKDDLYLCVGEIRLPVETSVKELFSPQDNYRFYYNEIDKVVWSVEKA
jgi:hypothetical protein